MSRRLLLVVVGGLLALALIDAVAARTATTFDLTQGRTLTLSPETKDVLRALHRPLRATVFLERQDPTRATAAALLQRYRTQNSRISFRLVEPSNAPAEAQRLGIDPLAGGVALQLGAKVEQAQTATEQDLTAAIARLLRNTTSTVCLTTGHGEADTEDTSATGFSAAVHLLERNGYEVRSVDLLSSPSIPAGCAAVVVASPTAPLGDPATAALRSYLAGHGKALVLADPTSAVDLTPVVQDYGLGLVKGLVLEGDAGDRFSEDPFRPVVRRYPSGNPIVRRLAPTFFPGLQAVQVRDPGRSGLTVSSLAVTSRLSYLERNPASPEFQPGEDLPGPITAVGAADDSANLGGTVVRTRLVVVGDDDFALNQFLDQAGNSQLFVRSIDWLTEEESIVTITANPGRFRPLDLTAARLGYLRLVGIVLIPALLLASGGLVWALRRGR